MKSIIQQEKDTCFICVLEGNFRTYGKGQRHNHHIFYGSANRRKSEEWGLKVWLCYEHHEGNKGVHKNPNKGFDLMLKQHAQKVFEQTHSRELFIQEFGKSWI